MHSAPYIPHLISVFLFGNSGISILRESANSGKVKIQLLMIDGGGFMLSRLAEALCSCRARTVTPTLIVCFSRISTRHLVSPYESVKTMNAHSLSQQKPVQRELRFI